MSDLFTFEAVALGLAVTLAADCRSWFIVALSKSLALVLSSKFDARTLRLPLLDPISGKLSRCFDRIELSFERWWESCFFESDVVGGADVIDVDDVPIFRDWDFLNDRFSTNDADDIPICNFQRYQHRILYANDKHKRFCACTNPRECYNKTEKIWFVSISGNKRPVCKMWWHNVWYTFNRIPSISMHKSSITHWLQ